MINVFKCSVSNYDYFRNCSISVNQWNLDDFNNCDVVCLTYKTDTEHLEKFIKKEDFLIGFWTEDYVVMKARTKGN